MHCTMCIRRALCLYHQVTLRLSSSTAVLPDDTNKQTVCMATKICWFLSLGRRPLVSWRRDHLGEFRMPSLSGGIPYALSEWGNSVRSL